MLDTRPTSHLLLQFIYLLLVHSFHLLGEIFTLPGSATPLWEYLDTKLLGRINNHSVDIAAQFGKHAPVDPEAVSKYYASIELEVTRHLARFAGNKELDALKAALSANILSVSQKSNGSPLFCKNAANAFIDRCSLYGPALAFVSCRISQVVSAEIIDVAFHVDRNSLQRDVARYADRPR